VRTKLKNVLTGKVVDRTFNAGAKVEIENVDRRDFTYLYNDGDSFVFMDVADYDQITVGAATVGDAANFLLENQQVQIALNNGNPLYIELPASVVLEITYTEPGLQGDRSSPAPSPPSRPATRSRCRCSSRQARRSRSTPARATTSAASTDDRLRSDERTVQGAQARLDILFQSDVRGDELAVTLAAEAKRAANEPAREASWLYAREIVDGVIDNRDEIDEQIVTHARDWKLERMPAVDRAILRLAVGADVQRRGARRGRDRRGRGTREGVLDRRLRLLRARRAGRIARTA
jgi:translation elongation factor P/translation initiation factor 5A